MDCKTVRSIIHLYLDNELPAEQMEPFLKHVHSCPDCYEELELSYIMLEGMRRLDYGGNIAVNFQEELNNKMRRQLQRIHRQRRSRINLIFVGTLLSIFGIILGYFEQDEHSMKITQEQLQQRGSYYFYQQSKQYIFDDTGYIPASLKEIIYGK